MDQEQRKEFDNSFFNHQEEMKGIAEVLSGQDDLKETLDSMNEKLDKLTILYTDLQEKYVNENNRLRTELTGRR